jgi:RND family efflux transporter MFP subunit
MTHLARTLTLLPLAGALAAAGCGGSPPPKATLPAAAVSTTTVAAVELPDRLEAGGVVRARSSAVLVSRILAPVAEVRVSPGDRVRRGQLLVVLDDRDLSAHSRRAAAGVNAVEQGARAAESDREAARAALALAQATHDRIAGLHERRSATAQELDEAVAALRAAEARAEGAGARVEEAAAGLATARAADDAATVTASFARLTAPFDGVITEKLIEPGNMASPGTPLLRVEDTSGLEVEARLDESRASAVSPGSRVHVVFVADDGQERTVEGAVVEVARAVDSDSRAFRLKVALPADAPARPGTFARLRFAGPSRPTVQVPLSSVVRRGQVTSVFAVDEGVVRLRLVSLGRVDGDQVEVLSGVSAGDAVVVAPPPGLLDGQPAAGARREGAAR